MFVIFWGIHVMLQSKGRICLHTLGILSICMQFIFSCDVRVCLTWEAKKENITFKCKVSQLKFEVDFLNPKNEEQGYCISPIPVPGCYSSHNVISQDLQTNTTILVIQRHVDSRLNGPWKCYHGTNTDEAIVNVTVIKEDIFQTIFKNDNCGEQHMAWTFIGVMIGLVIIFTLRMVFKTCQWNITANYYLRNNCGERCCSCRTEFYYATTQLFTCITLMGLTISIAYVSGLLERSCKDKEFFIIFGVCVVFMFVICLSIPRKDNNKKQSSKVLNNKVTMREQNEPAIYFEAAPRQALIQTENSVVEKNNDKL